MISGTEDTAEPGRDATLGAVPSAPGLARGHAIGRYLVLDCLGAGGMGVVYAAYDPELDRKIAVKLLHGRKVVRRDEGRARGKLMNRLFGDPTPTESNDPTRADDRLLREAQAMARVSHPNVIAVHDVGELDGQIFVAMEFIQGRTLGAWLKESTRPWPVVIDVMMRAGRGLAAAHDRGLVHRDFKPENVMIGDAQGTDPSGAALASGRVVVMDFGLVQPTKDVDTVTLDELRPTTDALGTDLTRTGTVLGTPAYMSPEQYSGRSVDARSDQFSFCVALWEGVYGERPFAGDSLASLATSVIAGQRRPPPPGARVPAHVRRVLERGLAIEPRNRFATMNALLDALARDPRRRQRRVLAIGTALVLVGGVFGIRQLRHARAMAACTAEGRAIEGVWNDDARRGVEASLLATGVPNAATTFAKLEPWLDGHAEAWTRVRTEVCSTAVRGTEMSDAPVDAMRECLDGQADAFAELVALLADADAMMVRKSVTLAAGLPGTERCTDPRWLARRRAQSTDPQVRELRRQLARATALEAAGKFAPALALAREVLAQAEPLEDQALVARLRYRIGALHEDLGDYAASERELVAAVFGSAEIGEDGDAADAAMRLAVVVSARLGRPAEGAIWARWAEVLVERLGEEADIRGARMHSELGVIARERGAFAEARAHDERSLELDRQLLGDGHPSVALSHNNLGATLVDLGLYDEGLANYERAREISEATLGPDHPNVALAVMNAAEVHWRREDLVQAHAHIERALAINEAAFGPDHPRVAQTLQNLGLVLHTLKRNDESIRQFHRALAIQERVFGPDHLEVANTLTNLADVQRDLGDVELALANHERALAIDERQLGPDHPELAPVLQGLGNDHRALGRHRDALPFFRRALAALEKLDAEHPHVGLVLLALAETELDVGHAELGRAAAERAQTLLERVGAPATQREAAAALLSRARELAQK